MTSYYQMAGIIPPFNEQHMNWVSITADIRNLTTAWIVHHRHRYTQEVIFLTQLTHPVWYPLPKTTWLVSQSPPAIYSCPSTTRVSKPSSSPVPACHLPPPALPFHPDLVPRDSLAFEVCVPIIITLLEIMVNHATLLVWLPIRYYNECLLALCKCA